MPGQEPAKEPGVEPRWPAALAVLVVVALLAALPGRIRLFPAFTPFILGAVVLAPMAGVAMAAGKLRWLRVERTMTLLFFLITGAGTLVSLGHLVDAMISRPADISGLQLLSTSIGVWITNVLAFSLLYWHVDRGGPDRANRESRKPDWLFPQSGLPEEDRPRSWRPTFVDYLYLGFSTATAFSATDALPLTPRAKMLMMLESSISLVTIVVVASRAINILGS